MSHKDIFSALEDAIGTDQSDLAEWSKNYYQYHQERYSYDLSLIDRFYQTGSILEIGSSPYHLTNLLKLKGLPVMGVDIDPVRQADFISRNNLQIVKCNIETEPLPFEDNAFHYIIFTEIFEHMRINPIATLREVNRVLHPDGVMVLSTPNLYSIRNVVNLMVGKGFDNPYNQFIKLETIGHMGHVREYTVSQVKTFLKNTGFYSDKVEMKSHQPLKGMWRVFNVVRKVLPVFHTYQVHICRKQEAN